MDWIGEFAKVCAALQRDVYETAQRKGWWDEDAPRPVAECLALIHSEVSEALEALRKGDPDDEHLPKYGNFAVELADVVIRVLDLAEHCEIPLGDVIEQKHLYNKYKRGYRHGKKF